MLNSLKVGQRFFIQLRPDTKHTWDFAKITGAGVDADPRRRNP
jgi:hypothetical protein